MKKPRSKFLVGIHKNPGPESVLEILYRVESEGAMSEKQAMDAALVELFKWLAAAKLLRTRLMLEWLRHNPVPKDWNGDALDWVLTEMAIVGSGVI